MLFVIIQTVFVILVDAVGDFMEDVLLRIAFVTDGVREPV